MLAALTTKNPRELTLQQVDIPELNNDEVLVKVAYCGVCGSDLHAYNHKKGYEFVEHPIILGHEISGEIVQVGDPSLSHRIGQHVIVEAMNYCGTCENCLEGRYQVCLHNKVTGLHLNGGMAEYIKMKERYVQEIPDIPLDIAALSEPLSVAVHAVNRLNKMKEITNKDVVFVHGAGIIGFFVALLCVEKGAKVYISGLEKDYESRLKKFETFNMIPHVVEHGEIGEKADIIFECSGSNQSVRSIFNNLKKGGTIGIVAMYEKEMDIFLTQLVRNEWAFITSYGSNPSDYEEVFVILKKHAAKLREIVSFYPLEQINEAFEDALNQKVLKPILSLNEQ